MHRAIPVTSKFLDDKWNRINHQKLQQRLNQARGLMSPPNPGSRAAQNRSPGPLSPIKVIINRAKRDQQQEETLASQNMDASVMTSDQIQKIFTQSAQVSPRAVSPINYKKSLNRDYRKRELQRISDENQAFLQRLQLTQPQIRSREIQNDYNKKIPVLRNMCEFPYILGSPTQQSKKNSIFSPNTSTDQSAFSYRSVALNHYTHVGVVQQWSHQNKSTYNDESDRSRAFSASNNISPRLQMNVDMFARPSVQSTIRSPVNIDQRQADNLDQNRVVHFKRGKHFSGGYFIVEISTSTKNLFIAAFDVESPASFLITVPFPKAQDVLDTFEGDFALMSDYLSFSRNKLVMLNPALIKRKQNEGMANTSEAMTVIRAQTTSNGTVLSDDQNSSSFMKQINNQRYQNALQRNAPWSQQDNQRPRNPDFSRQNVLSQEGIVKTQEQQESHNNDFLNQKFDRVAQEDTKIYNGDDEAANSIEAKQKATPGSILDEDQEEAIEFSKSPNLQVSNQTTLEIDVELERLGKK